MHDPGSGGARPGLPAGAWCYPLLGCLGVEAEFVEEVGDPVTAIVALAETRAADLIVTGTREPGPGPRET